MITKGPNNHIIQQWFSSPVYSGNAQEWADKLLNPTLKYLKKKNINKDRFYLGKTTYDTDINLATQKEFKGFVKYLKSVANIFVTQLGFDYDKLSKKFNPYVFATELNKGSFQERHIHNYKLSGILYLKVPPNSAPILFNDPVHIREYDPWPAKEKENLNTWLTIKYVPVVGNLLMWPAWLYHEVPAHPTQENRIGLVFNL